MADPTVLLPRRILGGQQPFRPDATAGIIRQANRQQAHVAFHVGTTQHGSDLEGLREAAALADGQALHVAHVNTCCKWTDADAQAGRGPTMTKRLSCPPTLDPPSQQQPSTAKQLPSRRAIDCPSVETDSSLSCSSARSYTPRAANTSAATRPAFTPVGQPA